MEKSVAHQGMESEGTRSSCDRRSGHPSTCLVLPRYWNQLEDCWKRYWSAPQEVGITEYSITLPDNCWRSYGALLQRCAVAHGYSPTEAEDLTQAFFLDLFANRYLDSYDPDRSSFRTFLRLLFGRFASKCARHDHALKRGAGLVIPMEGEGLAGQNCEGLVDWMTPDRVCQQKCVTEIVQKVERNLASALPQPGNAALLAPLLQAARDEDAALAREPRVSPAARKMRACRLRQRYRLLLRQELKTRGVPVEELRDKVQNVLGILCFLLLLCAGSLV